MRIAAALILALTASGCCHARPEPCAAKPPIRDNIAIEIGGTTGTKEHPAECDMGSIQVHVTFEIQRWPQGARGIEVVLIEVDSHMNEAGEPVPASPEPIVLARHDLPRVALKQWGEQLGSMFGTSAYNGMGDARTVPLQLTVSSVLWCNKPCTNGVCSLHGDEGKDTSEGDHRFELEAEVRIYGRRGDSQRVTLSEMSTAKTRVYVYCKVCPP